MQISHATARSMGYSGSPAGLLDADTNLKYAVKYLRGAYLEVLGDLLGSLAVIIAGLVIVVTGYTRADVIASVAIGLMILPRAWSLLRDVVDVLLEATPRGINLDHVRDHVREVPESRCALHKDVVAPYLALRAAAATRPPIVHRPIVGAGTDVDHHVVHVVRQVQVDRPVWVARPIGIVALEALVVCLAGQAWRRQRGRLIPGLPTAIVDDKVIFYNITRQFMRKLKTLN